MSKDAWLDWYQDKRVEEGVVDFAKMLKEAAANRILDFGCGTGRNTVYLVRVGFEVYGFDWSEAAVAATKQELSREKLDANLQVLGHEPDSASLRSIILPWNPRDESSSPHVRG